MKNVIPHFTADSITANRFEESFQAAGLFMDISGFTTMTAELMRHGKEGAEVLSAILNSLFTELIDAVALRGGFISTFAGDAFTALFPGPGPLAAAYSARAIQRIFADRGIQTTRFGDFRLTVKVGLSLGEVNSGVVGAPGQRAFYFRGPAVEGAAHAEHEAEAGMSVLTAELLQALDRGDISARPLSAGFAALERISRPEIEPPAFRPPDLSPEITGQFVPDAVLTSSAVGEFRNVISVFLSLTEVSDHAGIDRFAGVVLGAAAEYGGYFNSLDFGDKGCTMLVLFGAPVAHENDLVRAADCCLMMVDELGDSVRIGLTAGVVYAGPLGSERRETYTALGSVINLSARLMSSAAWGSVLADTAVTAALPAHYTRESLGLREYKGFNEAVETIRLTGRGQSRAAAEFSGSLIARDNELHELVEAAAPLKDGVFAGVTLLVGEAGSGKSRLLQELAVQLADDRDLVTLPSDGILRKSLNPIVHHLSLYFATAEVREPDQRQARFEQRFDALMGELERLPVPRKEELRRELQRTRSLLAALLGLHTPGSLYEQLDPQRRFENTIIAIKDLFRARSLLKPICIVFEDVQWMDADTARVLASLTRNMDGFAILIIAAGRFTDDGSLPVLGLDPEVRVRDLRLGPLPPIAHVEYVTAKIGGLPSKELVEFIAGRAEGNPFYMEQFCLYLVKNDLLEQNGSLRLRSAATDLPTGVTSLLTARLDRLRPELRAAVQAASVLGRDFERELLGGMLADPDLQPLLSEGESEQIWSPEAGGLYRFRQTLLRDAAYEMQLKDRLRELHGRAAALIESVGKDETRYADLAFHFELADNKDRTHHYLGLAAGHAQGDYKNERALYLYGKLLEYVAGDEERIDVYSRQSAILDIMGRWDETVAVLEQGIALCTATGLSPKLAALKTQYGEICQKRGEYDRAVQLLEEAAAIGHQLHNPTLEAGARTYLGRTRWSMGKYPEALESLLLAIEIRRSTGDRQGLALALYYAGVVDRDRGEYENALMRYEESLALFQEVGDKMLVTYPTYDIGVICLYRGQLDEALEHFQQANAIYEEIGYLSGVSAALLNLGAIAARRGRLAEAIAYYEQSLKTAEELGEHLAIAYALFSIGTAYYQERDYSRTLHFFERSFEAMKRIGARGYYGYVLSYLTCAYARLGHTARALKVAESNFRIMAELGSDVENGRTNLGVALTLARPGGLKGPNAQNLAAEISRLTGLPSEAGAHFQRAIEKSRAANFVNTLIPSLREYANHLLGSAVDMSIAQAFLREAAERAEASGMLLELALVRRSAIQHGLELKS